ncbi:MAG TPA: D-aminoacylase [Bacteroidota bacterium]|nr:D-aminoacylase [Bacteroidota bacterium]
MLKSRRAFIKSSALAAGALALPAFRLHVRPSFDIVLQGGTFLDGTGGPAWKGDIGIQGEVITGLGSISSEQAKRVVDISGFHVAPGFIDIHSHSDGNILAYSTADSRVRQGVTTELTGNCGSSAAPFVENEEGRRRKERYKEEGIELDWNSVSSYCSRLERDRLSINQALLIGQGTLRSNVVGNVDRELNQDELRAVLASVEAGMDEGAFGVSTGLEYIPGQFTKTDEIVELVRIVARYGGLYASHIRDEEAMLLEAVAEAIEIGRRTGARVEISHLKAAGRPYWKKQRAALDLIESAREGGVNVLADAYPYTAFSTSLTVFLPGWALEGGTSAMLKRLADKQQRTTIRREADRKVSESPGAYDLVAISRVSTAKNQSVVGKHLHAIAAEWKVEPVDALLRLIQEEEGAVGFVGHGISAENVDMVLSHPLVMVGSDGSSMSPVGRAGQSRPHPRSYGAFPRVLGHYCRERKLFDLPTAIKKMTSMPADQIGIRDRGRIARNLKADLVVFDAATIRDEATFDDPHRYPVGIHHVLVNGQFVVENGSHTGAKPGRALRRM